MSDILARQAIMRMNLREVAVAAHHMASVESDLRQMMSADPKTEQERFMNERRAEICAAYGYAQSDQRKPFAFANGVAIIPITGLLINRFGGSWGSITGYNFIRAQHNAALVDPDVTHIIHDHNSYGGEAAGCFELATEIFNSRGEKPILAVVDSNSYSASYALASAADKIIVTPSGGVGSVGVVAMHIDVSKALADFGVKVTLIFEGDHKVDGNPYEALPKEVKADIQKGVAKSYAAFTGLVARNRGMSVEAVVATQARTYRVDDALEVGFIDMVATPQMALQAFIDNAESSQDEQDPADEDQPENEDDQAAITKEPETMSTAEQQQAAAAAAAPAPAPAQAAAAAPAAAANAGNGAVDERARIKEITTCAEAEGRTDLANHFAFNTSMSAADAKAALAVAPKAPAAAATAPVQNAQSFNAAMAANGNPNVGADNAGAGGGGDDKDAAWKAAVALQEQATGVKLLEK